MKNQNFHQQKQGKQDMSPLKRPQIYDIHPLPSLASLAACAAEGDDNISSMMSGGAACAGDGFWQLITLCTLYKYKHQ